MIRSCSNWLKLFQDYLIKFAILMVFSLLIFGSCTEPPPPTLNSKDRNLVDSLYRDSIKNLRPIIDSLCELNFDRMVQEAVDSIMEVRQMEINKQLERIRMQ